MKKVSLQFKDVLQLLEFIELTKNHSCPIDLETLTITCELSEAAIELAVNAYQASLLQDDK
jgi:hypothetical protein